MIKGLGKLDVDDRINVALEVFKKTFSMPLPVLEDGRIVGIITTHDIIKNLAADNSAVNEY